MKEINSVPIPPYYGTPTNIEDDVYIPSDVDFNLTTPIKDSYLTVEPVFDRVRNDWTEDTAPTVGDIQKFTFDKECVEMVAKTITGKAGQPVEVTEEEQQMTENLMAYNLLSPILFKAFVDYLDHNKREGVMCVSNWDCNEIEMAFAFKDWMELVKYVKKFTNDLDFVKILKDG